MGGYCSGRRPWGRTRTEVEDCVHIDLYELLRAGVVQPGARHLAAASVQGPDETLQRVTVWSDLAEEMVVIVTGHHPWRPRVETTTEIACEAVPQPFGGERWYFRCPITHKRVPKLYLPAGATRFGSRAAYRLAYRSEHLRRLERR